MLVPRRLELAGLQVEALSVGGIETSYQVPAFDVAIDIGRCPPSAVRMGTLLLTHGHIDHAAGLPYYVSMRGMTGQSPPRVFVPAASHDAITRILDAWRDLQADTDRCMLIPTNPGDRIPLKNGSFARAFGSPHRIATIGYTLFKTVRKLRPELVGEPTERIAERVKAGEIVHEIIERPELCFPGDTRIEVVEREPTVTKARVLMLECTFVGESVSVAKARKGGHVHLDQIAERASLFQNEVLLLTHFSRRHPRAEIEREIERRFPSELRDRTQLLIHDES